MTETQDKKPGVWNDFKKLIHLSLYYTDSSGNENAIIYANNKNQAKIGIRVRAINKEDKSLNITSEDLSGRIFLCDSKTGNKIDESKWTLSEDDNGYSKAVNYSGQHRAKREGDGSVFVERYLSSSSSNENEYRFSVGIDIPGIGEFNTSNIGTNTKNCPNGKDGSVFKSPKSLSISTLRPINYSISSNFNIIGEWKNYSDLKKVVSDMRYGYVYSSPYCVRGMGVSCIDRWVEKQEHYGESSYATALIKLGNGFFFKNKIINKNNATFEGLNISPELSDSYREKFGSNLGEVRIKLDRDQNEKSADIIWVCDGRSLDFSFLFVDPIACGISADSIISVADNTFKARKDYRYYIGINDDRHVFDQRDKLPKIKDEYILVVICNHRIPPAEEGFFSDKIGFYGGQCHKISNKSVTVDIADEFGNEGTIAIAFNEDAWPQITVKGKLA